MLLKLLKAITRNAYYAIDKLSKDVKEDIAIGRVKYNYWKVILNTYLNRSFQIFDDPNYLKNIPNDVKEEAIKIF